MAAVAVQMREGEGRMASLGLAVLAVFSILSGRLWVLQGVRCEELQREAEQMCHTEESLPAKRGPIVDCNGVLLAASQTVFTIYADKYHLRDYQFAASGLAARDGIRAREVRRKYSREDLLREYGAYVVQVLAEGLKLDPAELSAKLGGDTLGEAILARGLEEDARRALFERLSQRRVKGVYFRKETRRSYPDGKLAAHVLGYVDREGKGQEGVEKVLQAALAGMAGYRRTERDSRGRELAAFRRDEKPPIRGFRVRLTLDRGLQELVEASLDRAQAALQPHAMAAILINPADGQVLAMASRPAFDLNTRVGEHWNVAVSLQYEPGSTFKIVAMAAAMDQGLVTLDTRIPLGEGATIGGDAGERWLNPGRLLAISSNEGIHTVARSLGPERLQRAVVGFGFGEPTGVWLSGEEPGQVHDLAKWSGTSLTQISMGYEVAVTPVQMLAAMAAVANGGKLLQPRVVQALESADGEVVHESKPAFVRRVMSPEASAMLLRALTEVTQPGGTGEAARVPGYNVAGKTGTARWFDPAAKKYQEGQWVVSFVGALPAERPQLAAIVVIDRPRGGPESSTGGKAAAPLFAEIARVAADYLDLVSSAELARKAPIL